MRSDIESETTYCGDFFLEKIKNAPKDDNTLESYEKRVKEVHQDEYEGIKPLQKDMFERMYLYIIYKEDIIKKM